MQIRFRPYGRMMQSLFTFYRGAALNNFLSASVSPLFPSTGIARTRRRPASEGKNLTIEYRFANVIVRPESIPEFAGDLVRLNMNVIFAASPEAVAAVRNATTSIPIVGLDLESDPVAKGYVKSLARPGMFLDIPELSGKQVRCSKRSFPVSLV